MCETERDNESEMIGAAAAYDGSNGTCSLTVADKEETNAVVGAHSGEVLPYAKARAMNARRCIQFPRDLQNWDL